MIASWQLVTAPDERERCCLVIDEVRCSAPTAFRIEEAEPSPDAYTHTCATHLQLVLDATPGATARPIEQVTEAQLER